MLKVKGLDGSRNFSIVLDEPTIDGSKVRRVFVPGKLQSDLKEKLIDLRVEFNPKEGHLSLFYL